MCKQGMRHQQENPLDKSHTFYTLNVLWLCRGPHQPMIFILLFFSIKLPFTSSFFIHPKSKPPKPKTRLPRRLGDRFQRSRGRGCREEEEWLLASCRHRVKTHIATNKNQIWLKLGSNKITRDSGGSVRQIPVRVMAFVVVHRRKREQKGVRNRVKMV